MVEPTPYGATFLDWLACASAGRDEPAARAAAAAGHGLVERVVFAGTTGHVLDFDDTYLPGLSHLSAPTAPAALVLGADARPLRRRCLAAYAAGFEAMGAVTRASHPALYDRGWHPTAVCGVAGAAVAAARLLGLDGERERAAVAIALLRAGGLRAAFGSDGKALQVGMAAAAGVHGRTARGGRRLGAARRGGARSGRLRGGPRRAASRSPRGTSSLSARPGSRPGRAAFRPTARSRPPTAPAPTGSSRERRWR